MSHKLEEVGIRLMKFETEQILIILGQVITIIAIVIAKGPYH